MRRLLRPDPSPSTLFAMPSTPGRRAGSVGTTHGACSSGGGRRLAAASAARGPIPGWGTGRRSGRSFMKRNAFATASMSLLLVAMLVPGSAVAASPQRFEQGNIRRAHPGLADALANMKGNRPVEVAVQLRGQPVSTYEGVAHRRRHLAVRGSQAGHPAHAGRSPAGHRGSPAWPRRDHPVHLHGRLQRLPDPGQGEAAGHHRAPRQRAGAADRPTAHPGQHQHRALPGCRQDMGSDRQDRQGRHDRHHRHRYQLLPRRLRGQGQRGMEGGRPHRPGTGYVPDQQGGRWLRPRR